MSRRTKTRSGPHPKGYVPEGVKPHQWKKGQSGNPKGRKKGSKWTRTQLLDALKQDSGEFLELLKKTARRGNVNAIKALLSPLYAAAQDNVIDWKFGSELLTVEDVIREGNAVLKAVGDGKLTPKEGEALSKILERQRLAVESAAAGSRREEFEQQEQLMAAIRNDAKAIRYARAFLVRWEIVAQEIEGEPVIVQAARAVTGDVRSAVNKG